jgi:hypothetical protein
MKPWQAIEHFGTQTILSNALGCGQATVSRWLHADQIPWWRQMQIEQLTRGMLRADPVPRPRRKFPRVRKPKPEPGTPPAGAASSEPAVTA